MKLPTKKICIRNIINDIRYPIFTIISSLSSRWLMIIMIYVISSSARLVHCYRPYRYTVSYPNNFYQNDKPCELPLIRLYSLFMISNLLYQTTWERGFFEIANDCIFFSGDVLRNIWTPWITRCPVSCEMRSFQMASYCHLSKLRTNLFIPSHHLFKLVTNVFIPSCVSRVPELFIWTRKSSPSTTPLPVTPPPLISIGMAPVCR